MIRRIKKSIIENDHLYRGLLNTFYGSLIQSVMIYNPDLLLSKDSFLKRMKKCNFSLLDDSEVFSKTVEEFFNVTKEEIKGTYLLVTSKWNTLVFPAVIDENGEYIPLPFFPDEPLPFTLSHPEEIYKLNIRENKAELLYDFKEEK